MSTLPSSEFMLDSQQESSKDPTDQSIAQVVGNLSNDYFDSVYGKAESLVKQLQKDGVFKELGIEEYAEGLNKDVVKNILVAVAVFMILGKFKKHWFKIALASTAIYAFIQYKATGKADIIETTGVPVNSPA